MSSNKLVIAAFDLDKSAGIAFRLAFSVERDDDALGLDMSDIRIIPVDNRPAAKLGRNIALALKYYCRAFIGRIRQTLD